MKGTYYRWTRAVTGKIIADILGSKFDITACAEAGTVEMTLGHQSITLDPDEARMVGVRLIEGASLADAARCVRERQ